MLMTYNIVTRIVVSKGDSHSGQCQESVCAYCPCNPLDAYKLQYRIRFSCKPDTQMKTSYLSKLNFDH